jgi:alpha-tubulin suppressor-like RCC1 family protein
MVGALTMARAAPVSNTSRGATATAPSPSVVSGAMTASLVPGGLSGRMSFSFPGRMIRHRPPHSGISLTPSKTKPHWACPEGPCEAIIDPPPVRVSGHWTLPAGGPLLEGSGKLGGYDPQDLQSAYKIPTAGGSTQTIALIEAYGYEAAESDLAKYRETYGLPKCTTANKCFRKVNKEGEEASYPSTETREWQAESALDLDMASAACPACHILLVEATGDSVAELAEAVNTAARLGATEISNSYVIREGESLGGDACGETNCEEYSADYDHPGVLVTASAGDSGYDMELAGGPEFPATSPYVVAVGGTKLEKASNSRGWSEEVWNEPTLGFATGSGCSRSEPKPVWQIDKGCTKRTDNDVAAVAACETPLSVYSSPAGGWEDFCGTSASAPLVAGIEAHASAYARSLPGADAFYADPGALFDVTTGSDGECTPPAEAQYLCHAEVGYDGPTGNGTPDGPLELADAPALVAARSATAVTGSAATLNGTLDAQGLETTYHFEYGTSTSYGTSVPVPDASAGSGVGEKEVSQAITGLRPDTTYHYRLHASNSAGASDGEDRAFKTAPPTITDMSTGTGPTDGGSSVTIAGTNFVGVTAVKFGSTDAKSFVVESETSISAVVPAGSGEVDVTVTTPAGTSATDSASQFSYELVGPGRAWGFNNGLLGDGATANSDVPVEVSGLPEAVALAAGGTQSLALVKNGTVMSWGYNGSGQLGDGSRKISYAPARVCAAGVTECPSGPYLEEVVAISAGVYHSLALLKDGTVVAWGENYLGQLGDGGSITENSDVPMPVCVVVEAPCKPDHYLKDVMAISAGAAYSLALLNNGTVMAWGGNSVGGLGDGTTTGPETCYEGDPCSKIPVAVSDLSEVAAIAAGTEHNLALLKNGTVKAWGENKYGRLGDGSEESSDVPVTVCAAGDKAPCAHDLSGVAAIAAGWGYSLALLKNGTVNAWGPNAEGELGDGTFTGPETTPVAVSNLSEVTAIAAGVEAVNSLALLKGGKLMAWGGDLYGSLGDGNASSPSDVPIPVCAAGATGPCVDGPYLGGEGQVTAMAAGGGAHDLVSFSTTPTPTVTNVRPSAGPEAGGTSVIITVTNFTGRATVKFGSISAKSFAVESETSISAVSPAGAGTVDVTVTTAQGTSATSSADRFKYQAAPTAITSTPTVVTNPASSITQTSATLNATVNANGGEVSECELEYGTTTSYGSSAPCTPSPGSGTSPVAASASVGGLRPNTTYHFRIVATNQAGTSYGADQALTTLPVTTLPVTTLPQQGPDSQGVLPGLGVLSSQEHKAPPVPDAELASTSLTASSSGTVSVKVTCPSAESSCTGTLTLRTLTAVSARITRHQSKKKAAILTLAVGWFKVAGGHVATVKLHLSAKARALLARTHVLRARATIVAHDPTGAGHTTETVVTLRSPKATRHR